MYYTARKYSPHPEVFITLTHYWQSRHNEYCYPSAQLLELLVDYTQAEGDFKWGVAHHPYPQSLFEPKSWLDDQATFDYDTPQITFKNLEVLDAWIKQPRALYQGKIKRTVFLSEQNPNSKDYSEEALREQAAGMAYAMKKLEACDGIDAYQMHGWFDQRPRAACGSACGASWTTRPIRADASRHGSYFRLSGRIERTKYSSSPRTLSASTIGIR